MTTPSYQDLVNGASAYFRNLQTAINADYNPLNAWLPQVGNYSGNGPNDFWNKAESLAQTYFPEYKDVNFIEDRSATALQDAQTMIAAVSTAENSIGYTGPAEPFYGRDFDRAVAVTATFNQPIFAGGAVASQVRQAIARDTSNRIQVDVAQRTAIQAVSQAWSQRRRRT